MSSSRINLEGRKFGSLTVLSESHTANSVYWNCICGCGLSVLRRGGDLLVRERRGQSQSCGCKRSKISTPGLVKCSRCQENKSISAFRRSAGSKHGVHGYCRECQDKWRRENQWMLTANQAKRRVAVLRATPAWADTVKIRQFFESASHLGLTVDHIVPIVSPLVCGLHVEHNLQLLTKSVNSSKGNKFWPDMP